MSNLFTIDKRSGQLFINDTNSLDVNRLKSDKVFFSVEVDTKFSKFTVRCTLEMRFVCLQATDGLHTTLCDVNITIRDVNNHAPQFLENSYMVSIAENTEIGIRQVRHYDRRHIEFFYFLPFQAPVFCK